MTNTRILIASLVCVVAIGLTISTSTPRASAGSTKRDPTWWDKYQFILNNGADASPGSTSSVTFGNNVDVSDECGPQSETFITINTSKPRTLAGGSNEIFRLPMRGYFSSDGGSNWGGVDLPLPNPKTKSGLDFGSDPSLTFDSSNNLFYSYIVVYFGAGNGVNGSEMAVAHSTDGGKTWADVGLRNSKDAQVKTALDAQVRATVARRLALAREIQSRLNGSTATRGVTTGVSAGSVTESPADSSSAPKKS